MSKIIKGTGMKVYNFRVHKHGNKLTMTLPSDWCKCQQVKQGDTLTITSKEIMPYKLIVMNFSKVELNYYKLKGLLEVQID
jgi:hypothetical protein